jgi:hypothetical protein
VLIPLKAFEAIIYSYFIEIAKDIQINPKESDQV